MRLATQHPGLGAGQCSALGGEDAIIIGLRHRAIGDLPRHPVQLAVAFNRATSDLAAHHAAAVQIENRSCESCSVAAHIDVERSAQRTGRIRHLLAYERALVIVVRFCDVARADSDAAGVAARLPHRGQSPQTPKQVLSPVWNE